MDGVVDGNVEPVEGSRELHDVIEVSHEGVHGVEDGVGGVEAVRLGDGVDGGELVVLETVGETVEGSLEGLGIELDATNVGPDLGGSASVPGESGLLELSFVVVETNEALSVDQLKSVLGIGNSLERVGSSGSGFNLIQQTIVKMMKSVSDNAFDYF